jgi:hypothetical protein
MEDLNLDAQFTIAKNLRPQDVLERCKVSKKFANFCRNPLYMEALLLHHYPNSDPTDDPIRQYKLLSKTEVKTLYVYLYSETDKVAVVHDKKLDSSFFIRGNQEEQNWARVEPRYNQVRENQEDLWAGRYQYNTAYLYDYLYDEIGKNVYSRVYENPVTVQIYSDLINLNQDTIYVVEGDEDYNTVAFKVYEDAFDYNRQIRPNIQAGTLIYIIKPYMHLDNLINFLYDGINISENNKLMLTFEHIDSAYFRGIAGNYDRFDRNLERFTETYNEPYFTDIKEGYIDLSRKLYSRSSPEIYNLYI